MNPNPMGMSVHTASTHPPLRRSLLIIAANATSSASPVKAAAIVATAIPPTADVDTRLALIAANPAAAAVIARLHVYATQRVKGGWASPSIDAAPTTIAARGPNRTAAKTVGRS